MAFARAVLGVGLGLSLGLGAHGVTPGPASAASASVVGLAASASSLRVSDVDAGVETRDGVPVVTVGFLVQNQGVRPQPHRQVRVFLRSLAGERSYELDVSARTRPLAPRTSQRLRLVGQLAPATSPGRYDVRVCIGPVGSPRCSRTSDGPVVVSPPNLVLDRSTIDLGTVGPGASGPAQPLTVLNTGGSSTGALRLELVGADAADFAFDPDTCDQALPPGQECTVQLRATPGAAATGVIEASLGVAAARGGGTGVEAGLRATVARPAAVTLSPAAVDFGPVPLDTASSPTSVVTATNIGDEAVTGLDIDVTGSPFTVVSTTCVDALAPQATCTVEVAFDPTTRGEATGGLEIRGGGRVVARTSLSGRGTASAQLVTSTSSLTWAEGIAGDDGAAQSVTLHNSGDADLTAVRVDIRGEGNNYSNVPFRIVRITCGPTLAARDTCVVDIAFDRRVAGMNRASLVVSGTGHDRSAQTVEVSLAGLVLPPVVRAPAVLTLDPAGYDLGEAVVGTAGAPRSYTVRNTGGSPTTTPVVVTVEGPGAEQFTVDSTTCTAVLDVQATCVVEVALTPTTRGAAAAEVVATAGATSARSAVEGIGIGPVLGLTPDSISFSQLVVPGRSSPSRTVTLANSGESAATGLNLTLSGARASDFTIVNTSCDGSLPAGATCTVDVAFTPVAGRLAGTESGASLRVVAAQSTATATLDGTVGGIVPTQPTVDLGSAVYSDFINRMVYVSGVNTSFGGFINVTDQQLTGVRVELAGDVDSFNVIDVLADSGRGCSTAPNFPRLQIPCFLVVEPSANARVGVNTITVTLATDDPDISGSTTYTVRVLDKDYPVVSITPRFDLDGTAAGTSVTQVFDVTNDGADPILTLVAAPAVSSNLVGGTWTDLVNTCLVDDRDVLLPGESCTITVTLTPAAPGPFSIGIVWSSLLLDGPPAGTPTPLPENLFSWSATPR